MILNRFLTISLFCCLLLCSTSPAEFDDHLAPCTDLKIFPDNWHYLEYKELPTPLVTCATVCNNFPKWFGDLDPATEDCGLDLMAAHNLNHVYFIFEGRGGQYDTPTLEPFNNKLTVEWRTSFWQGLRQTVEYAKSLDIICQVIIFAETLLEPGTDRWGQNIFAEENGGPVPGDGYNFFLTEIPEGDFESWNWKQWNAYYQGLIIEKTVDTIGRFSNVIFNPCYEINHAQWGLGWFEKTVLLIKEMESGKPDHLICVTPIQPDAFCELESADLIMIENRGIGQEYLAFEKPLLQGGPWARNTVPEPEFMYTCGSLGINPSTNLFSDPPVETEGFDYCLRFQAFMENVCSWDDEPGDEITPANLPDYARPWGSPPLLTWTGEDGFSSDAVHPDAGPMETDFEFRVNYSDRNNDSPNVAEVWIDQNDDGIFQFDERYGLEKAFPDNNYLDGVIYCRNEMRIETSGLIAYRLKFADEDWWPPTGEAVEEHYITVYDVGNP